LGINNSNVTIRSFDELVSRMVTVNFTSKSDFGI